MTVPANAICFFKDGDSICCVFGDFVDLQSSSAGFGATMDEAHLDLKRQIERKLELHMQSIADIERLKGELWKLPS
jgi:hypothetical protein